MVGWCDFAPEKKVDGENEHGRWSRNLRLLFENSARAPHDTPPYEGWGEKEETKRSP